MGIDKYFNDVSGKKSQKRLITFLAFLQISIAFIANLFFKYKVDTELLAVMKIVVLTGIGAITVEQFSTRKTDPVQPIQPIPPPGS